MKIDHHLHTSKHSPDSVIDPLELIEEARAAGLDGVVITEHDYQWKRDELAWLQEQAGDLLVLSGVEVSAREGHMLVYGLPDLEEVKEGIRLKDLVEIVRAHNAALVAAHPYRWGQDFRDILRDVGPVFDALELVSNNVLPPERGLVEATLADYPQFGATGSSDGHEGYVVGCYYSVFPEPIRSMSDFVRALKSRSSRPGFNPNRWLSSGPVDWTPAAQKGE